MAQLEKRRSSAKEAVPSGRGAPSPEDDVFRRFDRIVDGWGLVKLWPLINDTVSLQLDDAIGTQHWHDNSASAHKLLWKSVARAGDYKAKMRNAGHGGRGAEDLCEKSGYCSS